MNVPTDAQFFSRQDPTKPDVAFLKNHFYREGRVTEDQAIWILEKATALLRAEPNVLQVDAPITGECACRLLWSHHTNQLCHLVCGDIHGQYVGALNHSTG
jgi:serine/threonine-protein phosphatase 2B catalytic subunit